MQQAGVCVRYAVDDVKPTGTCCFCFVADRRTSVTDIGASKQLLADHLTSPGTRALMERAVCLYIECYQLGCCFDVLRDVGLYALENDKYVSVGGKSKSKVRLFYSAPKRLTRELANLVCRTLEICVSLF